MTFTTVGWVDVFTREDYKKVLIDSFKYCINEKGLIIHAFVFMSNHIHVIISAKMGFNLSDIVRDFKKHTAKTIIKAIEQNPKESRSAWMLKLFKYYAKYNKNNATYQFWRRDNKPIELESPKWINQKLAYIHLNPVRAGIVEKAEDYIYSSARQYLGLDGLLPIEDILTDNLDGYISS